MFLFFQFSDIGDINEKFSKKQHKPKLLMRGKFEAIRHEARGLDYFSSSGRISGDRNLLRFLRIETAHGRNPLQRMIELALTFRRKKRILDSNKCSFPRR